MNHRPRKRFGQNFLIDKNIIDKIILAIHPSPADNIVEIGPGHGALTKPLSRYIKHLTVIEIDRDLAQELLGLSRLTVHCSDALKFDFSTVNEPQPLRIVGNLPYNISTPLLFHLFNFADSIADMYFMLQQEVADRLVSKPCQKNYGRLSVMAQYYSRIDRLFDVTPTAFRPAPKVYSTVVRFVPHKQRPLNYDSEKKFSALVQSAFAQRRKTLRNNLKTLLTEDQLAACGIDPSARAETISPNDFIRLQQKINSVSKANT